MVPAVEAGLLFVVFYSINARLAANQVDVQALI